MNRKILEFIPDIISKIIQEAILEKIKKLKEGPNDLKIKKIINKREEQQTLII